MNQPSVSVIIPTFNRAHLITKAIRSILEQTYPVFEIIVVDDGSGDNTHQIVNSVNDARLRYIRHPTNKGLAEARNTGLAHAGGDLIAFLDSDDFWYTEKR
jgi:glycosyltransferase involved in cell wall biosynthesis